MDECVDERTGVMSRLQRSRSRSFPVAPQPSRRHAGEVRNPPSFTVCSGEMQPSYLQPCVITDADLRQIDMNVVFPTERPIMIIDDSPNWSTSWDWLSYLPTFHISCRLLHSAITDRFLRDRTRRCFDPDVEASGLVQRGPCV